MTPLRVAFVGKGGAGKSVVAGTAARLLARRGEAVLAVDSDPLPGMAVSLGVPEAEAPIPADVVEEIPLASEGKVRLRMPAVEAALAYAAEAPDGVRFLQFGKLDGTDRDLRRSQQAFRLIIAGMAGEPWHLVGDLPAGTRQPFFGWGHFADVVVVVAEPTSASLLTARRLARLALARTRPRHLVAVASKVRSPADVAAVERGTGLEVVGAVPLDAAVAEADRAGRAPLDAAPDAPAVQGVAELLDRLDALPDAAI